MLCTRCINTCDCSRSIFTKKYDKTIMTKTPFNDIFLKITEELRHYLIWIVKFTIKYTYYHLPLNLTPDQPEWAAFGFFYLKSNVFWSIIQQSFTLQICLSYTFPFKMYMPTKEYQREKAKKIMFNGSNFDRKSQLSGILTEPLNPRDLRVWIKKEGDMGLFALIIYNWN